MAVTGAPLVGVVCDDRPQVRRTVAGVLALCGFAVVGEPQTFDDLLAVVRTADARVAVITLPLAGMSSLAVVRSLRAHAPGCEVVVLSAFETLELAALEAGAWALVPEEDPQALRRALLAVAAAGGRPGRLPAQSSVGATSRTDGSEPVPS